MGGINFISKVSQLKQYIMGNCCCRKRKQSPDQQLMGISGTSMDAIVFGDATLDSTVKKGLFDEENGTTDRENPIIKSKSQIRRENNQSKREEMYRRLESHIEIMASQGKGASRRGTLGCTKPKYNDAGEPINQVIMELIQPDPLKPLNVDLPVQFSPMDKSPVSPKLRGPSESSNKTKPKDTSRNSSKNSSILKKTACPETINVMMTNTTDAGKTGVDIAYDEVNDVLLKQKITFDQLLRISEEPVCFDELTLKLTGKKKFSLTATDLCRQTVKKNRSRFRSQKSMTSRMMSQKASSKASSPMKALKALASIREKINNRPPSPEQSQLSADVPSDESYEMKKEPLTETQRHHLRITQKEEARKEAHEKLGKQVFEIEKLVLEKKEERQIVLGINKFAPIDTQVLRKTSQTSTGGGASGNAHYYRVEQAKRKYKQNKTDPDLVYNFAKQLYLFGQDIIKSEKLAQKAEEIDPGNPRVIKLLARICMSENNYTDAIKHMEFVCRFQFYDQSISDEKRAKSFFMIGMFYEKLPHKNLQSIQAYKKCLELDINHFEASFRVAHVMSEIDEGIHSIRYFNNALRVVPDYTEAHFGLMEANIDHVTKKGEAAIKHYQDKHIRSPSDVRLLTQLAILHLIRAEKTVGELNTAKESLVKEDEMLQANQEFAKACNYIKKAMDQNRQYVPGIITMGYILITAAKEKILMPQKRVLEQAKKYFEHSLTINDQENMALTGIAIALFYLKRMGEARKFFEKAQENDARFTLNQQTIMKVTSLQLNGFYEIKPQIKQRKFHEGMEGYFSKLAKLYSLKKLWGPAIALNRMAIIMDDKNLEAFEGLGDAYLGQENKDREKAYLTQQKIMRRCNFDNALAVKKLESLSFKGYVEQKQRENKKVKEFVILKVVVQACTQIAEAWALKKFIHGNINHRNTYLLDGMKVRIGNLNLGSQKKEFVIENDMDFKAPETYMKVFKPKENPGVDIWALGCLCYFLCTSNMPFKGPIRTIQRRVEHDHPVPISAFYSQNLENLIRKMLEKKKSKRPTAGKILNEPFIREFMGESLTLQDDLTAQQIDKALIQYEEEYEKYREIEKGGFASATLVKSIRNQKFYIAKKNFLNSTMNCAETVSIKEWQLTKKMDHKNIVKTKDSFYDKEKQEMVMIFQFCEFGDLDRQYRLQKDSQEPFNEEFIMNCVLQIASGLLYAHSRDVMHLDLKPKNIFVKANGTLKLGDFGISKVFLAQDKEKTLKDKGAGTLYYMSPEQVKGEFLSGKSDIWALGCIIHQLCTLEITFQSNNFDVAIRNMILQGQQSAIPAIYSSFLQTLVVRMLDKDPEQRPSAEEIINLCQCKEWNKQLSVPVQVPLTKKKTEYKMFVRLKPYQLLGEPLECDKEEETEEDSDSDDFGADRDTEFERKMATAIQKRIASEAAEENEKIVSEDIDSGSWISGAEIGAEMVSDIQAAAALPTEPLTPRSLIKKEQLDQENALRQKNLLKLANYRKVKKGHPSPGPRLILSYLPVWKLCDFTPSQGALTKIVNSGAIQAHRLTQIHWNGRFNVKSLTFMFSDGSMSPPVGTYTNEPEKMKEIPQSSHVERIEFLLHKNTLDDYYISKMLLYPVEKVEETLKIKSIKTRSKNPLARLKTIFNNKEADELDQLREFESILGGGVQNLLDKENSQEVLSEDSLNTEERAIADEGETLLVVRAEAEDMFLMEKEVRKEIDIRPPLEMDLHAASSVTLDDLASERAPALGGNEHIVAVRVDTSRYDTPRNITFMIFDKDVDAE